MQGSKQESQIWRVKCESFLINLYLSSENQESISDDSVLDRVDGSCLQNW
jgi:hypothetical protein